MKKILTRVYLENALIIKVQAKCLKMCIVKIKKENKELIDLIKSKLANFKMKLKTYLKM